MEGRVDADEHVLDIDGVFDFRSNGDTYMSKTELASMAQIFDTMAREYDAKVSRIESLEEHRDYLTEHLDEVEKEKRELRARIDELENRSLLDYLW
jgi:chromosome segregation ATPase